MLLQNKLKAIFTFSIFIQLVVSFGQSNQTKYLKEGYQLVWFDEFSGDKFNFDDWWAENDWDHQAESFKQKENLIVKNGFLHLIANKENKRRRNPKFNIKEDNHNFKKEYVDFTSASIMTSGRHQWQYGRFEMRAKIPIDNGLWPAFWTLGANLKQVGWPRCGEIDIMEYYKNQVNSNIGYSLENSPSQVIWSAKFFDLKKVKNKQQWADKFHVWRMDWDENEIVIYLDGNVINRTDIRKLTDKNGYNPFRQPHFIILGMPVGGHNAGNVSPKTVFPKSFIVDYVRVYQKK
ncbi:glycoside hydrolase family 16 protein [Sphingobacterium siyangense]|jgi:beta-glucanase (GH16 family)|uniref:Glycoside hydrolase family 16 protein n=2 Tax=Sphingobacterium TaxID=28453 RepID=A0ACD5BWM0_9SPHI|nr:glycoside hydrolase family 16 protein [Sphingobacterium multivorum]VXC33353.1 Glycosyl hydrolases family 16 [Sphingobacterium multivorum]